MPRTVGVGVHAVLDACLRAHIKTMPAYNIEHLMPNASVKRAVPYLCEHTRV